MSDEEKKAIDLLKNIDKQKCMMLECPVVKNNIERQLKIIELNRTIRKQSKEIEELKDIQQQICNEELFKKEYVDKLRKEIEELKVINQMQKYRIEVIDERELISKDKIRLKMKQEMDKGYKSREERHLQNYAYDRLKELLEE